MPGVDFPLSKREKKLLKEIEEEFKKYNPMMVENEAEFIESKEIMQLLVEKGYVEEFITHIPKGFSVVAKTAYRLLVDFSVVNNWVKDQDMKAKRLSNREWIIAIVSAIIGALIGWIPSFFI